MASTLEKSHQKRWKLNFNSCGNYCLFRIYEDDFEPDEDEIIQKERQNLTDTLQRNSPVLQNRPMGNKNVEDDIYDFNVSELRY